MDKILHRWGVADPSNATLKLGVGGGDCLVVCSITALVCVGGVMGAVQDFVHQPLGLCVLMCACEAGWLHVVLVVPSSASDLFACVSFRHVLEEVVLCRDCFGEALAFGGEPQHGPDRQSFGPLSEHGGCEGRTHRGGW